MCVCLWDLVRLGAHSAHLANVALLVQLLFGFVLQLADVLHGEAVPTVQPAEYLSKTPKSKNGIKLTKSTLKVEPTGGKW